MQRNDQANNFSKCFLYFLELPLTLNAAHINALRHEVNLSNTDKDTSAADQVKPIRQTITALWCRNFNAILTNNQPNQH